MTTAMHEKADRRRPGKSGRRLRRGAALRGLARREFFFVALLAGGLCAVALPFYLGKIAAARRSSVDRLWDAAHAALTDAHLAAVMTGQTGPAGSVIMGQQTVSLAYGYPTARPGGIAAAVATTYVAPAQDAATGWAAAPATPPAYTFGVARIDGCTFTYTEATASAPARITDPAGC